MERVAFRWRPAGCSHGGGVLVVKGRADGGLDYCIIDIDYNGIHHVESASLKTYFMP